MEEKVTVLKTDEDIYKSRSCVVSIKNRQSIKYGVDIQSAEDRMFIHKTFYNLGVQSILHYNTKVVNTTYTGFQNTPKWLSKLINLNYNKDIEVTMDKGETFLFSEYTYNFEIRKESNCLIIKDSYDQLNILKDYNRTLSLIRKMIKSLSLEDIERLSSDDKEFISTIKYEDLIKIRHQ
jgi:hypothetical protein|tara:strand:- start:1554 stop:2090 length:537 start_codon:yes stop_codon:yes gene_type:complete